MRRFFAMSKIKSAFKRAINYIVATYKYYSDKRFTTVAGTLVYFFLMSLAPFLFWLSMFFGNIDLGILAQFPLLDAVLPFLQELQSSAGGAASGAGIILVVTTLYSSTNFFYHLRRGGEIIYDSAFKKGGIKLRFASLGLIGGTILLTAAAIGAVVVGQAFLGRILNAYVSEVIIWAAAVAIMTLVAALLNVFICPYKTTVKEVISGSLLTVFLWLLCAGGFAVYTRFANPVKLYGTIASVIVFLLWCYLMMNSFVIGVIYNGRHNVKLKHALSPS